MTATASERAQAVSDLQRDSKESAESAGPSNADRLKAVEDFPPYQDIDHGDLLGLSLGSNTTTLTHGLHRFPAKYIPQVPRWALREFAHRRSVVLDPFMGSGTTLVESACHVAHSYGIDIDPLAQLITKAKTGRYNLGHLNALARETLVAESQVAGEPFLPMEGVQNIEHWFRRKSWSDLCTLYRSIEGLTCSDQERCFFLCVFSSILRWVSNADDQTQKTYVSGTLKKTPPLVWETYKRFLSRALAGVEELDKESRKGAPAILDGSALAIPLEPSSIDLVITSPPYLDSVDYMYNFMLEYFWLGPFLGVPNRAGFNQRRRGPVGAKNPTGDTNAPPPEIAELVRASEIPAYRQAAVLAYFHAMRSHFIEAARVLRVGGRYVLVVGNSQADNGVLPVHDCLLRLARAAGLHMEKAFAYRIRRHYMKFPRKGRGGIILMDWVITLRKTSTAVLPFEDRLPLPNIRIGNDEVAN